MAAQILPAELLIHAYQNGVFPMAEGQDDPEVFWVEPRLRGVLPLDRFHVPRSLRKVLRQCRFEIRCDTAFLQVMAGCAASAPGREETWINRSIVTGFHQLHRQGLAHSIECWAPDPLTAEPQLVGGLYGLALAGAFFGESMFSRQTDASKVALCYLVARLKKGGFSLLDTQFMTEHLARFGAEEIPQQVYLSRLQKSLSHSADFTQDVTVGDVLAL